MWQRVNRSICTRLSHDLMCKVTDQYLGKVHPPNLLSVMQTECQSARIIQTSNNLTGLHTTSHNPLKKLMVTNMIPMNISILRSNEVDDCGLG